MGAVERGLDVLAQGCRRPIHRVQLYRDFEYLLAVAHVRRAGDGHLAVEPAKALAAFLLHLGEGVAQPRHVDVASLIAGLIAGLALAAHDLHAQIRVQHPPGEQFNLKQMPSAAIATHLTGICEKEAVAAESGALQMIAHAARGSMRDALSLLDQAIAFCAGNVQTEAVRSMLGTVDRGFLVSILECLAAGNLPGAIAVADDIQARSLSFDEALGALATLLHNIALIQAIPEIGLPDQIDNDRARLLATHLDAETVQLYYQIALHGRRDLSLAPDEFAGFTMTLMRMALFRPDAGASDTMSGPIGSTRALSSVPAGAASRSAPAKSMSASVPNKVEMPVSIDVPPVNPVRAANSAESAAEPFDGNWPNLVRSLKLGGLARQLADRSELVRFEAGRIVLSVSPQERALTEKPFQERLRQALAERLGHPLHLELKTGVTTGTSVAASDEAARQSRTSAAQTMMQDDPFVRALVSGFDARIESIKSVT